MEAFVTLVATDSYCQGALVLAHRLWDLHTTRPIVCLVTPEVSQEACASLEKVCKVIRVNTLRSHNKANLSLLGRPELDITYTKLHAWRLTDYTKIVFLDADTLPLRNVDELFDWPAFSAAPDAGWPDCFNSGVFVAEPSEAIYDELVALAAQRGSFDGGDQGLLNTYFSQWSTSKDHRLPFIYNTTPTAQYSYAPAHIEYRSSIAISHFIGYDKPWKWQRFADGTVFPRGNAWPGLCELVQCWWDTWTKHYGKTLPHELCSGFASPVLGELHTQPVALFETTLANAWDTARIKDDMRVYEEKRHIAPLPPLHVTLSTPLWMPEEAQLTQVYEPIRNHSPTDTPYHGLPDIYHPNENALPDLHTFINAWDRPRHEQPVWVAPKHSYPQPETLLGYDYSQYNFEPLEVSDQEYSCEEKNESAKEEHEGYFNYESNSQGHQEYHQDYYQETHHDNHQEIHHDNHQEIHHDNHQEIHHDNHQEIHHDNHQEIHHDNHQEIHHDNHQEIYHDNYHKYYQDNHQEAHQEYYQEYHHQETHHQETHLEYPVFPWETHVDHAPSRIWLDEILRNENKEQVSYDNTHQMDEYMQAQMEKIVDDLESGNQMEEHHHIEPARENYQEYRQASDYSYPTGESEEQSNSEETKYNILEVYEDEMEVQKSLEIYPFYSCHEEQHHEEQHHEEQHREEQHHEEMANSEWQGSQYAMDSVPPSPHRSPYASFISADIDDDWSDRDLIPIPFKSSSRLSTEGYSPVINSEESTSSRRNSLKSRLSISLPKSPRSPHSPFSGTLPAISHQSSKLFASSQTFYGEKTPYTSAAATPVHEKSFFIEESDSVHQQRNDFLAFTDYTFGRSLLSEQQGSSLSASEMENEDETDWDTSMALERLRGQSASMLFAQIAESHANEKTTRTIHTQNTSTWDVVSESEMLMSGPVSPINNVLPDTYEWSQREVPPDLFSGHVSPRTPVARGMTYNLTDEIGLAKENYKAEQRASLSLVQPLMAAATLLEAQLDLSKGRLFKRRASPNLQANTFVNKETSFSSSTVTEPWHNVGGVYSEKEKEEDYIEEAFTAYFDESIMKEAQMKLLELTSLPKKDYAEDDKEISESLFFSCEPVSMAALARTENESAEATYNSDTSNKSFSVTSPTEATVEHPVKEWGLSYSDMWSSENAGQHSALFEERMAELLNPGKKENTSRTKASATRFTIETRADKSFREEKNGFSFGAFGSPDSSTSPWTLMDAPETSTTIESHSTMTLATPVLLQGSYNEGAGQDLPLTASLHSHDDNVKELVSSYSHTKSEQKILEPEITESTEYHLVKSEPCEESTIIFDSSLYSVDEVVNCQTVDLEEMKIDNVLNPTFAVTKEMEMIETEDSRDFIDTKEYEENEVVKEILSRSISTKETEEVEITEETTRKSIDIKETEKIEVVKEISDISTDIKETKETKIEKAFSIPTSVIEVGDVSAKASTNIIEVEEMAAEDVSTKTYANIIEVEEMAAEDVSSRDCIDMEETEEIVMEETEETKVFETEKTSRGISITLQETEVLEVTETEDISRRISIDIEDIEMIDECSSTKEFTDIKETEEIEVYGISSVGSIDTKEAVEIQVIKSQDILRRESIDIEDIVVIEVQDIPTTRSIQVEEIQVEQAQVEQAPIHVLSNEESTVITETEYQEEELSSTVYEVIYETIQVDSIDMDNSDAVLGVRASTINTSQSIPSTQRVVTRERPSRRLSFQSARNVINNLPSMESTLSRESVMSYDSISSVVTCIPDTEATEATGATGATGATSQESNEGYSNILMRTIQDPRVTLDEVSVTVESASDRDLRETIEAYVHTHSRVSTSEDYESEQIHSESSSQGQGTRISRGTLSTRGSSKDGTESEHSGAFGSLVYVSANESNNDMMSVSSGVDSIDWHSATGSMDFVEVEAQDGDEDEAETDARVAQWVMDEIDSPSIHRLERSRSRDHLLYRYFQRQQLTSDAGTCRTDSLDKLHVYDSEEEGSVGSDKTAT